MKASHQRNVCRREVKIKCEENFLFTFACIGHKLKYTYKYFSLHHIERCYNLPNAITRVFKTEVYVKHLI